MKTPKLLDTINRDHALQELDDALHSRENVRLHERYQVVNMVLQGHSYQTISQMVKRSMTTIGRYVDAYRQDGLNGLAMIRPTGRPRRLTEEQEQQLYDLIVEKTPADVGFPAEMNWRAPLLKEWIRREWDQSYSDRGVRALLYRLHMSFTCPTYTLAKADPVKQEAFRKTFRKLQIQLVLGSVDRLLFQDESMIRDYQALTRTWFPKGQQKIIPTFGKHWGAKMLGTLDYMTGEVFCLLNDHYDARVFLEFLEQTVARYPGEKVVMILDNAKIHHAKLIQPFLAEHRDDLTLVFLPPYSPQMNLIEPFWGWLKRSVIDNVFFHSVAAIKLAVQAFIAMVNTTPENTRERLCMGL